MYRYVSVQSFAGGFDVGATQAGMKLVHKVEQKGGFGMNNCLKNRHILGDEWTHQSVPYEQWEPVAAEIVLSNPPCSGFSVMTDRRFRGVDANVNSCMHATMAYAGKIRPEVVVMESVPSAFKQGHGLMKQLRDELEEGSGRRYTLYHVMQNALHLGGAAYRPRYFWVASTVPFGVQWPRVRTPVLRDVIGDLDGLGLTWHGQPYRRPPTWWSKDARSDTGIVDGHVNVTSPYTQRALDLMRENGGWPEGAHIALVAREMYRREGRLPKSWEHMVEKLIQVNKATKQDFHMGYTSMTRWIYDRHARVITGGALGLVLHPTEPRTITHREAARVMGFPDDWLIGPLRGTPALVQTWGKGITTQCGKWIGSWVVSSLNGYPGADHGVEIGDREMLIGMKPPKEQRPDKLRHRDPNPQEEEESSSCDPMDLLNQLLAAVA